MPRMLEKRKGETHVGTGMMLGAKDIVICTEAWGHLSYSLKGEKLHPGSQIEVAWPDGSRSIEILNGALSDTTVGELYIKASYRGCPIEISPIGLIARLVIVKEE
jgi:hypothetical protein